LKDFLLGFRLGKSSLRDTIDKMIKPVWGDSLAVLLALDSVSQSTQMEMEIIASINHMLGKNSVHVTAPLKVSLFRDFANSSRRIVVSDSEFEEAGGYGEEEGEQEV